MNGEGEDIPMKIWTLALLLALALFVALPRGAHACPN
jgi:hypothetical protein